MRNKATLIILSLLLGFSLSQAQNPLLALLGEGAGSEERLLYKKPAGNYEVTVDGERLLERTYFNLDIRQDGEPIPADSKVTLSLTPPESAGIAASSHTARHDGERFVVDSIQLKTNQDWGEDNWFVNITINDEASTSFGTLVYAPKPEQSTVFSVVNIALPIIVLAVFMAIYALRAIRLEQTLAT